jgi:hypothetical protein
LQRRQVVVDGGRRGEADRLAGLADRRGVAALALCRSITSRIALAGGELDLGLAGTVLVFGPEVSNTRSSRVRYLLDGNIRSWKDHERLFVHRGSSWPP